jgi:hypothetical protein
MITKPTISLSENNGRLLEDLFEGGTNQDVTLVLITRLLTFLYIELIFLSHTGYRIFIAQQEKILAYTENHALPQVLGRSSLPG